VQLLIKLILASIFQLSRHWTLVIIWVIPYRRIFVVGQLSRGAQQKKPAAPGMWLWLWDRVQINFYSNTNLLQPFAPTDQRMAAALTPKSGDRFLQMGYFRARASDPSP
jgi:hypothetical protein